MFNLFKLSGFLIAVTTLLVIFVVSRGKRVLLHKMWALFNLCVCIWGLGSYWVTNCSNYSNALLAWKVAHIGVIFIPITFFHVVCVFTQQKHTFILRALYVFGFVSMMLNLFTGMFITHLEYLFDSFYYARSNNYIYHIFFVIWSSIVVAGHVLLVLRYKLIDSPIERTKIQYFFYAVFTGFIGGIMNFFPILGWKVYPVGNILIPIYCILVTYAILRFRLLDISVVITRTGIFVAVYSIVLGIPFALAFGWKEKLFNLFAESWWLIPLASSTVLATAGPFIYLYFQKRTEDRLFQEQRRYQATLRQASYGMGRIKDLRRLLNLITHIVTRTVGLEFSAVYVYDSSIDKFFLGSSRSRKLRERGPETLKNNSAIVGQLRKTKGPIVYEEIKQKTQEYGDVRLARLESELSQLNAAVIVPSFIDENLLAFIVLGNKASGKLYVEEDLAVFSILANQAALAIENAQFYENLKNTHAQLVQAEKMATVGTMADGLSHQINNRLHALGFIAGDVLDSIKLKKNSKMSSELKELMIDIEHALSRIQDNVEQGGEIVRGLLRYTRKGEEGFTEVDLDKLLDAAIEMTQFKIKEGQMDIVREFGGNTPKIKGNFTQLQEVFFNIIDNAYDAMMQKKRELKEPDYRPTLKVGAEAQNGTLNITIKDNGIGIKKEDKGKLFTPFFTTKASSKKGTGLGLYVIQKIIEENHGGKVVYDSEYKKGTETKIKLKIF